MKTSVEWNYTGRGKALPPYVRGQTHSVIVLITRQGDPNQIEGDEYTTLGYLREGEWFDINQSHIPKKQVRAWAYFPEPAVKL